MCISKTISGELPLYDCVVKGGVEVGGACQALKFLSKLKYNNQNFNQNQHMSVVHEKFKSKYIKPKLNTNQHRLVVHVKRGCSSGYMCLALTRYDICHKYHDKYHYKYRKYHDKYEKYHALP